MVRLGFALVGALTVAVLTLDALSVDAQSWTTPADGFRVEWEPMTSQRGPAVRGYVYNDGGHVAGNIRLIVESLDGAGQLAATTIGYLSGTAPAFGRLYFEVPVKAPATSYRVRVGSWEAVERGGA
ncbi:MAG: hypothetical protein HYU41_13050 [Candidatus Rokubacteria bacterium]|nr:hypothetical protein [Candidatus Rokubacteria bacterium]